MGDGGYIRLWRKLLDSPEWKCLSGDQSKAMIALLLMASWRRQDWVCPRCKRLEHLEVGDCVASTRQLAEVSTVGRQACRTLIDLLSSPQFDFLTRRSTHCHTVISIKNFGHYQEQPGESHPQVNPRPNPQPNPQPNPLSLYEEGEEGEEGEATRAPDPTTTTPTSKRSRTTKPRASDNPLRSLLQAYEQELRNHRGLIVAAPATKANLRAVGVAAEGRDPGEARRVVRAFVHLDDPFLEERGWPLRFLPDRLSEVVSRLSGRQASGRAERLSPEQEADLRAVERFLSTRGGAS